MKHKVKIHTLNKCSQCPKWIPTKKNGIELSQPKYDEITTCSQNCRRKAQSTRNRASHLKPKVKVTYGPIDNFIMGRVFDKRNIVKNAIGDGITDDTAAIQATFKRVGHERNE